MIKVVKKEWDDYNYNYIFTLENEDQVAIHERDYYRIMIHFSEQGRRYEAIVDEHEDAVDEEIEYLGFVSVN